VKSSSAGDLEKELIELNMKIGEAEKQRDEAFLKRLLSEDLIFRRANGKIVNKKEYLESLQDPANTYDYIISEDVKPTIFEDVAVVSLRVRARGKRGASTFEGNFRNIRLFLKNQEWQCAVWFNTPISTKISFLPDSY
jgi:hypothetical protein